MLSQKFLPFIPSIFTALASYTDTFHDLKRIVNAKKYTEDHEWVEVSPDGKTGMDSPPLSFSPSLPLCPSLPPPLKLSQPQANTFT